MACFCSPNIYCTFYQFDTCLKSLGVPKGVMLEKSGGLLSTHRIYVYLKLEALISRTLAKSTSMTSSFQYVQTITMKPCCKVVRHFPLGTFYPAHLLPLKKSFLGVTNFLFLDTLALSYVIVVAVHLHCNFLGINTLRHRLVSHSSVLIPFLSLYYLRVCTRMNLASDVDVALVWKVFC